MSADGDCGGVGFYPGSRSSRSTRPIQPLPLPTAHSANIAGSDPSGSSGSCTVTLPEKSQKKSTGKRWDVLRCCGDVLFIEFVYDSWRRRSNHLPISDLHIFVDPIKPAWEDPLNGGWGKWTIQLKKRLANRGLWETLIFSLVGGGLEKLIANPDSLSNDKQSPTREHKEICGAVLSIRRGDDILAVWHRTGALDVGGDGKMVKHVKLALQTVLQLPLNCHLVYKLNADCLSSNVAVSMTTIPPNIQRNPPTTTTTAVIIIIITTNSTNTTSKNKAKSSPTNPTTISNRPIARPLASTSEPANHAKSAVTHPISAESAPSDPRLAPLPRLLIEEPSKPARNSHHVSHVSHKSNAC
ncbi:hypothetical protein PTTG_07574 [Puccinia triticina 1-1 BBBD Race 1]|uniref:Uncharacterized protein n=1 Tax=Puccinia triticina (isolate 1-1 / race 1 (BBBD)) TaxID=630390 RepID=A0A180GNN0_PUCT1|nr:hypothetical protein PTTG_07574 [Puccinia triticina 1-1 BBBD Race 1]